ncbi:MAG TPA: YafY family protein [Levilinea sp.]|nr:YafY family protein [Levilinea sp.]
MRADRLLSILMLLQAHGRMTARALSLELEVSERTIYRDIEALSMAGVPVYAERGPGGGVALLDSYRTNLTGLTQDEVRALFALSIPAPLVELGLSQELKAAMRKLAAGLPETRRAEEEPARQRIYLDSAWWHNREETPPHLHTLHQAIWQNCRLHILYWPEIGPFDMRVEDTLDPYGLVAKASVWYLVAAREGRPRIYRVGRILEVEPTGEHFERPPDFDLEACWKALCEQIEENRSSYPAKLRVSPALLPYLQNYLGERCRGITAQSEPDAGGWTTVDLVFEYEWEARTFVLGWGRAVEVLEPEVLRLSVIDYAGQILAYYRERGDNQ